MKIPPSTTATKGFTLIEILIATAILAALAAGMWEASAYAKARGLKNTATAQVQLLETAMNAYRTDSGGTLPFGRGDEYSSHVLYKTLFCDHDNDGEPDTIDGATAMPYCPTLVIVKKHDTENQEGIPCMKYKISAKGEGGKRVSGKYYLIIDPWGNPYRYRLGYEVEDEKGKTGPGINPDFDIFSQGPDGLGQGKTNADEDADNVTNIRSWK
ncbi:MAG: prepilin-type N-terminal cleavage/methylation domain-containing protein [Akkermansia sp.]